MAGFWMKEWEEGERNRCTDFVFCKSELGVWIDKSLKCEKEGQMSNIKVQPGTLCERNK